MKCKCGGITGVIDSRPRPTGTWRRRKCSVCNLKFTTYEMTQDTIDKILKMSVDEAMIEVQEPQFNLSKKFKSI